MGMTKETMPFSSAYVVVPSPAGGDDRQKSKPASPSPRRRSSVKASVNETTRTAATASLSSFAERDSRASNTTRPSSAAAQQRRASATALPAGMPAMVEFPIKPVAESFTSGLSLTSTTSHEESPAVVDRRAFLGQLKQRRDSLKSEARAKTDKAARGSDRFEEEATRQEAHEAHHQEENDLRKKLSSSRHGRRSSLPSHEEPPTVDRRAFLGQLKQRRDSLKSEARAKTDKAARGSDRVEEEATRQEAHRQEENDLRKKLSSSRHGRRSSLPSHEEPPTVDRRAFLGQLKQRRDSLKSEARAKIDKEAARASDRVEEEATREEAHEAHHKVGNDLRKKLSSIRRRRSLSSLPTQLPTTLKQAGAARRASLATAAGDGFNPESATATMQAVVGSYQRPTTTRQQQGRRKSEMSGGHSKHSIIADFVSESDCEDEGDEQEPNWGELVAAVQTATMADHKSRNGIEQKSGNNGSSLPHRAFYPTPASSVLPFKDEEVLMSGLRAVPSAKRSRAAPLQADREDAAAENARLQRKIERLERENRMLQRRASLASSASDGGRSGGRARRAGEQ